ncbi:cobalamin biosynthesis protein [Sinorhizobium numidicum]|uniref:Cobalamin biosynthesis protein n=1 Tax=Sinorhizobium numidicum TaxID=680248 RepID=A0ABY8CVQ9_9HYPH|nr:cobalamin biosynthesis protein [Sinorhizobium numidicum]WEX76070.1 cobalamin biosynthesis protein [Sinorhizobium numidicum]WEX82729.1 cobalamin biosynthesis protein [Sinorhizobium numidicum]
MSSVKGPIATTAKLVLGLGCERGTAPEEVIAVAERALAGAGASAREVVFVASLDARAGEPAIHAAARHFSVPVRFFNAATLEAESPRLQNPSEIVFAHTGCHGVAEGAALAGAGQDAVLIVPKVRSARATAAVAGPARCAGVRDAVTSGAEAF